MRKQQGQVSAEKPEFAASVAELARILSCQERAVYRWFARGCPSKGPKGYPVAEIEAWRGANVEPQRREKPPPTGVAARLLAARMREKEAVAKLKELEYALTSGKYNLTEKVQEHDLFLISLVTQAIDGFARSLPPHLVGLDERGMISVITKEGRALRSRMARMCGMQPDVETPEADRWILEAGTALDFASRFYEAAFGCPVPPSCRGQPLGRGSEIVEATLAKIRSLKGDQNGRVDTEPALPASP